MTVIQCNDPTHRAITDEVMPELIAFIKNVADENLTLVGMVDQAKDIVKKYGWDE
jgi:hypothetical protein